jgi:hypothetical protein
METELKELLAKRVYVYVASTDETDIAYYGRLTKINEETGRFVISPAAVHTNIKGREYVAQYAQGGGPSELGFDISDIKEIDDNMIKVNI